VSHRDLSCVQILPQLPLPTTPLETFSGLACPSSEVTPPSRYQGVLGSTLLAIQPLIPVILTSLPGLSQDSAQSHLSNLSFVWPPKCTSYSKS
jgi:hypothetical protein